MMKLSRLLSSRKQVLESVKIKDAGDGFGFHPFSSRANMPTPSLKYIPKAPGNMAERIFASYSVFKGKAALSVNPILPTFTKLETGNLAIARSGVIMLLFTPSIGERKYDWQKRQVFALSPTEVGTLISLGPKDSCEFYHDPSMLSSNAGQVRKSLSIKSLGDGTGYFISLGVTNKVLNTKENFTVPFTAGEFAVMRTACSFALPHILGWDRVTKFPEILESASSSKMNPQMMGSEWEK